MHIWLAHNWVGGGLVCLYAPRELGLIPHKTRGGENAHVPSVNFPLLSSYEKTGVIFVAPGFYLWNVRLLQAYLSFSSLGLPYMTSSKLSNFFTPLPLVTVTNQLIIFL